MLDDSVYRRDLVLYLGLRGSIRGGERSSSVAARRRPLHAVVRGPSHAIAHSTESTSACSSTVCVAFSCLSGG
jgi:hypothetical protein